MRLANMLRFYAYSHKKIYVDCYYNLPSRSKFPKTFQINGSYYVQPICRYELFEIKLHADAFLVMESRSFKLELAWNIEVKKVMYSDLRLAPFGLSSYCYYLFVVILKTKVLWVHTNMVVPYRSAWCGCCLLHSMKTPKHKINYQMLRKNRF